MRLVRAVLVLSALLLSTIVPLAVEAQPPDPLRVTLFSSTVRWSTAPSTTVRVALRKPNGQQANVNAIANAQGQVTAIFPTNPQVDTVIRAGDLLGIHPAAGGAFTRTVPAMTTALDAAGRRVQGTAPAGAALDARAYRPDNTEVFSVTVAAAGDGGYGLDLPPEVALEPGTWGSVTHTTPDGDRFAARWDVLYAQVTLADAAVTGRATMGTSVRAQLSAGGAPKGSSGQQPTAVVRTSDFNLTLRQGQPTTPVSAGDRISVTQTGGDTIGGVVPPMTVQLDATADRVTGTGPANQAVVVAVEPGGGAAPVIRRVTTDELGRFTVDLAGQLELLPGMRATASHTAEFVVYRAIGVLPQVRANLYSAIVQGSAAPGTAVAVELRAADGSPRASGNATVGGSGNFQVALTAGDAGQVRSAPGDRLVVTMGVGAPPIELILPDLTAVADVDTDQVAGQAVAGAPIQVSVAGQGGATLATVADGSGGYTVDFSGRADLVAGSTGQLVVTVAGGHSVALAWAAPRVDATLASATVRGIGPAGRTVRLELRRGGIVVATAEGMPGGGGGVGGTGGASSWTLQLAGSGGPEGLQAGDILAVTVAGQRIEVPIPALSLEPDAGTNAVEGTAPAGRAVRVTASRRGRAPETRSAVADHDGRYRVDFDAAWDLSSGDNLVAQIVLDGGHTLSAEAVVAGITLMVETGVVSGVAAPSAVVSATLRSAGGMLRAHGTATAGGGGRYTLALTVDGTPNGAAVGATRDDVLSVSWGTSSATMVVPLLTVEVDLGADHVNGQALPVADVAVHAIPAAGRGQQERTLTVRPEPDGSYRADFAGQTDLAAGTAVEVSYRTAEGHIARIDRLAPMVHVQSGGNRIYGTVPALAVVSAELQRGGAAIATEVVEADADGTFEAYFTMPAGGPRKIEAGDVVEVDWRRGAIRLAQAGDTVQVSVPALSAQLAVAARTLSGSGPPETPLTLVLRALGVGQSFQATITTSADGTYARLIQGTGPLPAGMSAEVGYYDPNGHRVFVLAVVPYLEAVLESPNVIGRAGPLAALALALTQDGAPTGAASPASDTLGNFSAALDDQGAPASLQTGRRLRLTEPGGATTDVDLPVLTAELDTAARQVRGTAPAGTTLRVRLYPTGRPSLTVAGVQASAEGRWSLEDSQLPPGSGISIAEVVQAEALLNVDNGHLVIARAAPGGVPTPPATVTPGPGEPTVTPTVTPRPGEPTATATATNPPGQPTATAQRPSATPRPGGGSVIQLPIVVKQSRFR